MTNSLLFLDGQEELKFWWQLLLAVESVREINSTNSAIRMDGHPQCLNVVGPVGSTGKI